MSITARFYVESVTQIGQQASQYGPSTPPRVAAEKVVLQSVYSDDKNSPNYSYSKATPNARVELLITNEAAWGYLPGHSYDAAFTPTGDVS